MSIPQEQQPSGQTNSLTQQQIQSIQNNRMFKNAQLKAKQKTDKLYNNNFTNSPLNNNGQNQKTNFSITHFNNIFSPNSFLNHIDSILNTSNFQSNQTEQTTQQIVERKINTEKNKLLNEKNILEIQLLLQKETNKELTQQYQNLNSQRQLSNSQYDKKIKTLQSQLKQSNEKNQSKDKQLQSMKSRFQQQKTWLKQQINEYFCDERAQRKNENIDQFKELKDVSIEIQRLGSTLMMTKKQQAKEKDILDKVMQDIISRFNKISIEEFMYHKYESVKSTRTFFKQVVQSLKQKLFHNAELKHVPKYYQQLFNLLTSVDTKVNQILLNWNKQLTTTNQQYDDLKTKFSLLQSEKIQKDKSYQELEEAKTKIESELNTKIKAFESQNKNLRITTKQLEDQIKQEKIDLQKQKQKTKNLQKTLTEKIKQFQTKQIQYQREAYKQLKRIEELQIKKANLTDKIQQLLIEIQALRVHVQQLQRKRENLQEQLRIERSKGLTNSNSSSQLIKSLQEKIKNLQKQISSLNQVIKDKDQQIDKNKQNIIDMTIKYKDQQQKIKSLKRIIQKNQQQIQILDQIPKFKRCYPQYFNGNILNYTNPEQTQWFVSQIQKYMGKKQIIATKFIYRLDPKNNNNPHNYIDGHKNLVVIIKHINGQVIGAFSEPALQRKANYDRKKGLMVGFKNRRVFHVKKQASSKHNTTQPRPLTWDENYIIFGNSDLRIINATPAADNLELYSNYGTGNGSFDEPGNKDSNIDELFTDGNRKAKYLDFEVFSIVFGQ